MNNGLYKALKEGVVTVEFTKIDTGELRVMPCTLNQDIHKQRLDMKNYTSNDTMICLLYTSPSPRDLSTSRMPSSA